MIGARELSPIIGPLARAEDVHGDAPRAAPGQLDRHYAPRARVELFAPADAEQAAGAARALAASGVTVGAMTLTVDLAGVDKAIPMPPDPIEYAHRLYATLHELDDVGCDVVFVERVPEEEQWLAITDRLVRAATPAAAQ